MENTTPQITAIIPNYRTLELTRLCLRLLAKHSDLRRLQVIVVDNHSQDGSLDYLRKLKWIRLIERTDTGNESGPEMHGAALDLALSQVDTPFTLVMHTDTLVIDDHWLDFLLGQFTNDRVAGVGSWKLEAPPSVFKRAGQAVERLIRRCLRRPEKTVPRYLRSHCAVYRTELLKKHTLGFRHGRSAGESAHLMLAEAGFELKFIPSEVLGKYIRHLNHATMILNPRAGDRKTAKPKARKQLARKLGIPDFFAVLNDESLDQIEKPRI